MARVTVEDCIDKVTNRFDLVLLAAQRARDRRSQFMIVFDKQDAHRRRLAFTLKPKLNRAVQRGSGGRL